jgi:hypothetical protein
VVFGPDADLAVGVNQLVSVGKVFVDHKVTVLREAHVLSAEGLMIHKYFAHRHKLVHAHRQVSIWSKHHSHALHKMHMHMKRAKHSAAKRHYYHILMTRWSK